MNEYYFTRAYLAGRPGSSPGRKFKKLLAVAMNNNTSKGISYKTGFFLLIGLAFVGLAVAALVGGAILVLVTGGNTSSMKDLLNNPANAGVLRVIQTISVLISMFLPAVLAALI